VFIDTGTQRNAIIRIITNGGESTNVFETSVMNNWDGCNGNIYIKSVSAVLTNCIASWTCDGYASDIYVFGDSYLGLYDGQWPYNLVQDGFGNNCLLNGYGGETSSVDIVDAQENLLHNMPKYLLWLPGMNDPDTSTAVNSAWNTAYNSIKEICASNHIELVLATIPCVPERNHTFKNAIVRESGYRYIDFAKAVGAETSGSAWYSRLLSGDNVHPSSLGAKVLYLQVLSDFPEITIRH
jgi:hypothetical protein